MNLQGANLWNVSFYNANLRRANLQHADLRDARDLTLDQLSQVESLYETMLDPELLKEVRAWHPHLLEKPGA